MKNKNYFIKVSKDREINDFYATNPDAINDLFNKQDFNNKIWEPAAGQGHLVYRMSDLGKEVYASDLIDRGENFVIKDFLSCDERWDGDIITNPPFKHATDFVYKSMDLIDDGSKVALFLKLLFLESMGRRKLFDEYPPKNIHVYSKRISTIKGGGDYFPPSTVAYCWIVWEKGFKGKTELDWI
jgi:hypothetical protein